MWATSLVVIIFHCLCSHSHFKPFLLFMCLRTESHANISEPWKKSSKPLLSSKVPLIVLSHYFREENVPGLGTFCRDKSCQWMLIQLSWAISPEHLVELQGNAIPLCSILLRLFHCTIRQAEHTRKGDWFCPFHWFGSGFMKFLIRLWTFRTLLLSMHIWSLFFPALTSLSISFQGSIDFPYRLTGFRGK